MSQNQSRVEKKAKQYRKTGGVKPQKSSTDQLPRSFSATGSGASPAPPLPSNNRSFKKSNNAQGGQSRENLGSVNTTSSKSNPIAAGAHPVENGNRLQSTLHAAIPKPVDTSSQKSNQPISKALPSQSSSMTSESTLPSTPSKGEEGKGFPLQFGSINPGFMKVPARTSSAPPDLDEQMSNQVRRAVAKTAHITPVPSPPKQQVPEKPVTSEQPNAQESPTATKVIRDVQVTCALSPQPMQAQKPAVVPMAGMSMPTPYHQHRPPVPLQFGGPNPHIQTQGTPNNSFHMQMPLHVGSPPQVQQQVFMPSFQHHLMQNQGIIHQGQNFGFNPQLGPPLPHQTGSIGVTMSPQFNLQQPGKSGGARTTVKITHPETHEELRLDNKDGGSPGSRSHHMGPPPSQAVPSYTTMRPSGYYSNTYTSGPPFFPVPISLPLTSTQSSAISQAPRFNCPINQAPPTMLFMNQPASNTFPNGKGATSMHGNLNVHNVFPSAHSTSPQVTVKAAVDSATDKGTDSNAYEKIESQKSFRSTLDPAVVRKDMEGNADDSSLQSNSDPDCLKKPDVNSRTNTDVMRDVQKQPKKKYNFQSLPQVGVQADSGVLQDHDDSLEVEAQRSVEAKISGKDQYSTQNGHLLQATEQQGEEEGKELKLGSAFKDTNLVERTGQRDHEGVGFEASQGETDSAISRTEGNKAALQTYPLDDMSKSMSDNEATLASVNISEASIRQEIEITERERPTSSSADVSGSNKIKNNRGKKKKKEMLQKADALGTTTDLYMAYKHSEEKKETIVTGEGASRSYFKVYPDDGMENGPRKKKDEQSKLEPEDWEDAVVVSTPKLESIVRGKHRGSHHDESAFTKKYSRDFLLTFSGQFTDLPENFQVTPDIADVFLHFSANASRSAHEYASSGRINDKASGAARNDRRVNGMMDVDRRNKLGSYFSGRDSGIDLAYSSNMMGFRPGQGPNYGVLKNPRGQGHIQHGGILSGPMGFLGTQRNNPDGERWQRATNFNKGLMPTPSQMMHRAENKYEVGKVSDEEQAKQRRLKAILNKLTPQNFEKLFEQVKEVNIDNAVTLTGVISQIFDKALTEPTFCEMYANFCYYLASELPDLSVDNEKITFKRLLLNKCQEEFERGEREEEEANKDDSDGEIKQTEQEREGKRLKARRRMLGNIRLIGELYKKRMLTERIMHECIKKLLGQYQNPEEENIEALCKLLSTIGEMIDHPRAKEHIDAYYDIMGQLSNNEKLSSRVRFMLKDAIDLRKNKWQQRMKVEGPKKIEEVHRDAAQERLGQAGRVSHGPNIKSGTRRGQPLDYGSRGSMLHYPAGQFGGFKGTQARGYGGQDLRMDDRSTFESRTFSIPLPQRFSGDEPITLGPQGGLARGMSCRGTPSTSNAPTDVMFHRGPYNSREDHFVKQAPNRFGTPFSYDHSDGQELNCDRNMDKSVLASSNVTRAITVPSQSIGSEKVWPEERLRDKSLETIKEYYSINDKKEVALCIKDLNAPKFYPTVISIWVTDSFERKDIERDKLAKLLILLTKPQDGMFSPEQLIEGFESVLTNFEDTVTDAPKAPEFLGRIFGKLILQNVFSFDEVGRLIHKGGEESGRLLEIGLAADILGSTLEMIKLEKGESTLNDIRTSSSLRLEDFRPPDPLKSKKLEMFLM